METKVLIPTKENIQIAADYIKAGELCGMPTETVYGLAADALNEEAVGKIFKAKGRPQDNPLIVHISKTDSLKKLCREIPDIAWTLAESFWPGPLTMILKKAEIVPLSVTAGLDTVAIRMPSHKVASAFIEAAQTPIAAPSANLSGKPSPTSAAEVYHDLNGKIPVILDGGESEYGLESTVVLINDNEHITLLRPGAVTVKMLQSVAENVTIDKGVLSEIKDSEKALSPGMKHKHYSPDTHVVILDCSFDKFKAFIEKHVDQNIGAMVFEGEDRELQVPTVVYGAEDDPSAQAHLLFHTLRAIDELNVETVYARRPETQGIGLAIYNRLLRAAGFEVITL